MLHLKISWDAAKKIQMLILSPHPLPPFQFFWSGGEDGASVFFKRLLDGIQG